MQVINNYAIYFGTYKLLAFKVFNTQLQSTNQHKINLFRKCPNHQRCTIVKANYGKEDRNKSDLILNECGCAIASV